MGTLCSSPDTPATAANATAKANENVMLLKPMAQRRSTKDCPQQGVSRACGLPRQLEYRCSLYAKPTIELRSTEYEHIRMLHVPCVLTMIAWEPITVPRLVLLPMRCPLVLQPRSLSKMPYNKMKLRESL